MELQYIVPSRIHISLYDMNGNLGRLDGGIGFSLDYPRLVFQIKESNKTSIELCDKFDSELLKAVENTLKIVKQKLFLGEVKIKLLECIPSHMGFGSKTATVLSIGHAYANIFGYKAMFPELAILLKRGGTSGVGINLIDKGGFCIDGGHSVEYKQNFTPSSFVTNQIVVPPLLARYPMPEWEIMLIVPKVGKIFGITEIDFFSKVCPVPENDIEKLARIILSQTLPSICEKNFDIFCQSINLIQEREWKRREIEIYGNVISDIITYLKLNGAKAVGMSSIGPGIYVLGNNLRKLLGKLKKDFSIPLEIAEITKPNNTGVKIREI